MLLRKGLRTPCRLVRVRGRRRRRRRRHGLSLRESRNLTTTVVCPQRAAIAEKLKCAPIFQPPICSPRRAGGCMQGGARREASSCQILAAYCRCEHVTSCQRRTAAGSCYYGTKGRYHAAGSSKAIGILWKLRTYDIARWCV